MKQAHIVGWGSYLPQKIVTNQDLAQIVDTSSNWIYQRTGIRQRHIAASSETSSLMAIKAAHQALTVAALDPMQLDLIIVATLTPEKMTPTTACQVQHGLGAKQASAFDLNAACSGFIYAMTVATQMIATGLVGNALVIGSETLSRVTNWQDRSSCILFGDGAGAVVLQGSDMPGGIMASTLGADGSGGELIDLPVRYQSPIPALIAPQDKLDSNLNILSLNGRQVFRFASRIMVDMIHDLVEQASLSLADVDLIIPHQANARIIESAAKKLNLPLERFFINIDRVGNTSAASIPLALCDAVRAGYLQPNDRVMFVGFGGGLTWAASLVQWTGTLLELPQIVQDRQYAALSLSRVPEMVSL